METGGAGEMGRTSEIGTGRSLRYKFSRNAYTDSLNEQLRMQDRSAQLSWPYKNRLACYGLETLERDCV